MSRKKEPYEMAREAAEGSSDVPENIKDKTGPAIGYRFMKLVQSMAWSLISIERALHQIATNTRHLDPSYEDPRDALE